MKIFVKFIYIMFSIALLSPSVAFADNTNNSNSLINKTVKAGPSTGTLVGAALETAGYVAQAKVLKDLEDLIGKLGALTYLICIICGIVTVALLGNPGNALWLLVGPPVFFFMINTKTTANGVEWRLGEFQDKKDLKQTLAGVEIFNSKGEEVSWFFHHYNVLISDTIQQLISFVTNKDLRHQMKFMARQQIIDDMFSAQIDSPEILELAQLSLAQCMTEIDAARRVGLGMRDPHYRKSSAYNEAVITYCEYYPKVNKYIPLDSLAFNLVKQLEAANGNTAASEPDYNPNPVNCETIWNWLYLSVKDAAKVNLANSKKIRVYSEADTKFLEEIDNEIGEKLTQPAPDPEKDYHEQRDLAKNFTCKGAAAPQTVSRKELIPLIFAGYLIKKAYAKDPRGKMTQQLYDRAGVQLATTGNEKFLYKNQLWSQEVARRNRVETSAEASKYESYTLAKMLPYVQGAGLYVLAVTFPFFALLLIIPGKAGGFFMWCALWAWLKSWDLGWALIMIADEILWVMMPHSSFFRLAKGTATGVSAGVYSDPVNVLEAAFGGDYAYNLSTYYTLIGAMITAVPMLTAHAVLGSKRAVAGIFVDGLKTIGQFFGSKVTDWVAVEQLAEVDKRRELSAQRAGSKAMKQDYNSLMEPRRNGAADNSSLLPKVDMKNFKHQFEEYSKNTALANNPGISPNERSEATSGAARNLQNMKNSVNFGDVKSKLLDPNSNHAGAKFLREHMGPEFAKVKSLEDLSSLLTTAGDRLNGLIGDNNEANKAFLSVKGGQDYGNPTRELEAHRRQIEVIREQAEIRRGLGEIGILAAIGTAPARALPGGTQINNVLMNFGTSMAASGVQAERIVSEMSINHLQATASHAYYQASKSDEYNFYENTRAGISQRAEHWGVPFSPYQKMVTLDYEWQSAQADSVQLTAQFFGTAYSSGAAGLKK